MFSGRMNISETLAIEEGISNQGKKLQKVLCSKTISYKLTLAITENLYTNDKSDLQKIIICNLNDQHNLPYKNNLNISKNWY